MFVNAPSKGEQKIIKILQKSNSYFKREVIFNDLKGKKKVPLRFDFGIYGANGKLLFLCEYDGEQHFHQVKKFQQSRTDLLRAQEYDRKKNSYCLSNGIKLYRIPFWEYESINELSDLSAEKFLVTSKWHNDLLWKKYSAGAI